MLKLLFSVFAAIAAPLLSFAGRANRRSRLRASVTDQIALADALREHFPSQAAEVAGLIAESVAVWTVAERRALHRRFDTGSFATVLFLIGVAIPPLYFAWTWESWLRWPLVVLFAIWILLWIAYGSSQLWKVPDENAPETP